MKIEKEHGFAAAKPHYEKTLELVDQSLALDSQAYRTFVLTAKAHALLKLGRGKEALPYYLEVSDHGSSAVIETTIGQLYQMLATKEQNAEYLQRSAHHLNKAVKLNPNYFDAHVAIAALALDTGNLVLAQQKLSVALSILPNHPQSLFLSGVLAERQNNIALAYQQYIKALQVYPLGEDILFRLGAVCLKMPGRQAEGAAYLNKILSLNPQSLKRQVIAKLLTGRPS